MTKTFAAALILAAMTVGSAAQAKSLGDVKLARCTNEKGAQVEVNAKAKSVRGHFGTLKMMSSDNQGNAFGLIPNYPMQGTVALGALVIDQTRYWGNMSILASMSNQNLGTKERLKVFFTDTEGHAQMEDVICDLAY